MARHVRIILSLAVALFCVGCGGDEPGPSGSGTSAIWDVTISKTSNLMTISEQKVNPRGDGGITLVANGSLNGETVAMTLDIAGGTEVTLSSAVQIGSPGVNFRMKIGDTVYRGTTGSVTFTAYDTTVGQTVTAAIDSNFVAIGAPPAVAGTLKGDFSGTVTEVSSAP